MKPQDLIPTLEPVNSLASLNISDEYPFVPLLSKNWKTKDRRILFVIETVDSTDLKDIKGRDKRLLRSVMTTDRRGNKSESNTQLVTFSNLLNLSWLEYRRWNKEAIFDSAIGVVNFNAIKMFQVRGTERRNHELKCVKRLKAIIAKLKPTQVVVFGDTATSYLFPEDPDIHIKRGLLIPATFDGHETLVTPTLDLEPLYSSKSKDEEDDDSESDASAAGDLLYFVSRNVANTLAGTHLYSLRHIRPKCILVDTIEKFDKLFAKLKEEKVFAFDSETANLESYNNRIYTYQFAFSDKAGYLLPLWHPNTPFSKQELSYIAKRLQKFFGTSKPSMRKRIIVLNGSFDFRVMRAQLNIPVIYHQIWDVAAGESLLDENVGLFDRMRFYVSEKQVKTSLGNLRNLFTHYDNDFYLTAPFSKEQRDTIGGLDILTHTGAQDYSVMDCQSIYGIYTRQLERASLIKVRMSPDSKPIPYLSLYERHVSNQMSNTVHAISHMMQNGSYVDKDYLLYMLSDNSPLLTLQADAEKEFLSLPNVEKANKLLLKEQKLSSSSLFKKKVSLFDINKPAHKQTLFFQVMNLEPIEYTKTKTPSVNTRFYAAYKDTYKEAELLEAWNKIAKLLGTYVKGWYEFLNGTADSRADNHLRPSFGFFSIVTGRLNSFKPSLQQVPSRGKLSHHIKRMFRAPKGSLLMKWDFSAHEVRLWGILADDPKVAKAFRAGQKLRQQLIKAPSDEIRQELKRKGDVHIQNVFLIFNKWIEKSDPLRDAIKAIIFGLIYGKAAASLAKDIAPKEGAREELLCKIKELKRQLSFDVSNIPPDIKMRLKEAQDNLKRMDEQLEDPLAYAKTIMDNIFAIFSKGKDYLNACVDQVNSLGYVITPLGRRRNLYRVFTGRQGTIAAAERRAKNSPIQGIASEIGSTCAYLVLVEAHKYMVDNDVDLDLFPKLCRSVHDANHYECPYEMVIPMLHIMQYVATYGVTKYYHDVFDFKFNMEPEIEIEVATTEDKSKKWDWELPNIVKHIKECLAEQVELGDLSQDELEPTIKLVLAPWSKRSLRTYLQTNYPLLGVIDLDEEIKAALAA